jgi:putative ABC transport system permease protein
VLVALGCAFGTSTAIFNTTYDAQARVDAQLTNGADVTVTGTSATPAGSKLAALAALPAAASAQPLQHRYAYVGRDLQDLYGIDAAHIGEATAISDAYFAGGNARATLAALAARPDAVLVSEETVTDYQLQPGDLLNLRLQDARDRQYHVVPFHFSGVVREFPTAPKDSFLIANASYVARATGSAAAEIVLLRARDDPAALAAQARAAVRDVPSAQVTDISTAQQAVGSSLTAIDLHSLTRLELGFALLLVLAATGLVLTLGLVERRRTFTILALLGATPRQLRGFLWGESLIILGIGATVGVLSGFGVAQMLVTLLAGVFDPPPESLAVPWAYLTDLLLVGAVSAALAILGFQRASRRPDPGILRGL